jgi:hypothetical protein
MSLNDTKIRSLKPSAKPSKFPILMAYIFWSIQAVHVSGISNIVSVVKNPGLA